LLSADPPCDPGAATDLAIHPAQAARLRLQLEQRLAAVRAETLALQQMLEELPTILENKFRQRLHQVWAEQAQLLQGNQVLLAQLQQRGSPLGLSPADADAPPRDGSADPTHK
jgi:phosphoglycolate phosphatase-like HAD superfamily hydrolase